MRIHTGGVLTLGKGAAYATSTKQKLTTKSSTEAELVGVNDMLSQVLWTQHFLDAQGYGVTDSTLSTKTIRVQCYWRTTVVLPAVNVPAISISGSSLFMRR
jgi:hypothetical protein